MIPMWVHLTFVKILWKCCQKDASSNEASYSIEMLAPRDFIVSFSFCSLKLLSSSTFKFLFKAMILKIIYSTLGLNIFLGLLFWSRFNGIYSFPWEILSSYQVLNLFCVCVCVCVHTHNLSILYSQKIKAFLLMEKKMNSTNAAC